MKSFNMSGAATKISGMYGAMTVALLEYNYNPDVISGISSGTILSMISALLKEHPELQELVYEKVTNFKTKEFMSKPPFNDKGKITVNAGLRVITGKPSLGKQDNLVATLGGIITRPLYNEYIRGIDKYPDVVIGTVDYTDGKRKYFDVRKDKLSYEEYLKYSNASASIPIAVEPVDYHGRPLFDGGVRDHIGAPFMLKESCYADKITSTLNIFSRPEDYQLADTNWSIEGKSVFDVAFRTFDIMNIEISKNDEIQIIAESLSRGLDSKIIYLTNYMESLYDTDKSRLILSYNEGIREAREQLGLISTEETKEINKV